MCYFLLKYLIDLIRKDCKTSFNWLILIDKMCRLKMHLQHDDACDDLDGGGIIRDVFHGTKRDSASSASEVRVRERAHDI